MVVVQGGSPFLSSTTSSHPLAIRFRSHAWDVRVLTRQCAAMSVWGGFTTSPRPPISRSISHPLAGASLSEAIVPSRVGSGSEHVRRDGGAGLTGAVARRNLAIFGAGASGDGYGPGAVSAATGLSCIEWTATVSGDSLAVHPVLEYNAHALLGDASRTLWICPSGSGESSPAAPRQADRCMRARRAV